MLGCSRNKGDPGLPPGVSHQEKSGWKGRVLAQSRRKHRRLWEPRGGAGPSPGDWEGFLEEDTPDLSLEVGVERLARLRKGQEGEVLQVKE